MHNVMTFKYIRYAQVFITHILPTVKLYLKLQFYIAYSSYATLIFMH